MRANVHVCPKCGREWISVWRLMICLKCKTHLSRKDVKRLPGSYTIEEIREMASDGKQYSIDKEA